MSLVITPENVMMIPWWERSEKDVKGTERQRERQTDRTDRQTEQTDKQKYRDKQKDSIFF